MGEICYEHRNAKQANKRTQATLLKKPLRMARIGRNM